MTRSEQQRFFTLFSKALHDSGREPGEMDLGLFFLHFLSPGEALTVLEERRDLVVRSQEIMEQMPAQEQESEERDILQGAINDHIKTLLAAERAWLNRTIARLQTTMSSQGETAS